MLDQPPIFLGGQGGAVGPVITGYGTVVAAGSVLRDDVPQDNMLVTSRPLPGFQRPVVPHTYRKLTRLLEKNVTYMANLVALREWYVHVRRPFFEAQELGPLVYEGALEMLASAMRERTKRLGAMVAKVSADDPSRAELRERIGDVLALFEEPGTPSGDAFLTAFRAAVGEQPRDYVSTVQQLPAEISAAGVRWLQSIVDDLCTRAAALVPATRAFTTS